METIIREYLSTHPFLTFSLDMQKAPFTTWMLLAEAQTMGEHIAGVPLLPSMATTFHQLYLAKGVLATTAIEGNTLIEEEVVQLLNGKLNLPPSREYLGQEVDNIVEACNQIVERLLLGSPISLTPAGIVDLNRLVLQDLPLNSEVVPGNIRENSLSIGSYRAAPPEDLDYLLERLCNWLNKDFTGPPRYTKSFGILKAIVAHVYLAWIQPFEDGNGRTARLVEFQILLSCGLSTSAAHLLSYHYNQTRSQYQRQIEATHRSNGDILPFIDYALEGFLDGLTEQLKRIREQQLQVHWINYVHEVFRNKDGITDTRIRRLVLDLSTKNKPTPRNKVRYISPRMAEAYALYNDKTIQRDIKKLKDLTLVVGTKEGIRANYELMSAFLPPAIAESVRTTSRK